MNDKRHKGIASKAEGLKQLMGEHVKYTIGEMGHSGKANFFTGSIEHSYMRSPLLDIISHGG